MQKRVDPTGCHSGNCGFTHQNTHAIRHYSKCQNHNGQDEDKTKPLTHSRQIFCDYLTNEKGLDRQLCYSLYFHVFSIFFAKLQGMLACENFYYLKI